MSAISDNIDVKVLGTVVSVQSKAERQLAVKHHLALSAMRNLYLDGLKAVESQDLKWPKIQ